MKEAFVCVASAYLIVLAIVVIGNGIADPDCAEVACSAFMGGGD